MLETALMIMVFWAIYGIGTIIAYDISENRTKPFNYWDKFPFKCRRCLTFWTLLAMYSTASLLFGNWWLFGAGIAITIMETIAIIITEIERFKDDTD